LASQFTPYFWSDRHGSVIAMNNQPAPTDREYGKSIFSDSD